jgi:hypothetical protein
MKNLKLGILACGAVCLVILLTDHFVDALKGDTATTLLILIGYAAPTAMGAMGMSKPPFVQWQAIVSAAGFVLPIVKLKMWDALPHIADAPAKVAIFMIATVVGLVLSILAIAKPEDKA